MVGKTIKYNFRKKYSIGFKYDWNNCIQQSTNYLHEQLEPFIDEHNYLDSIWIIGHSTGGVITALLSEQWDLKIPITVHSVAASLGEYNQEVSGCNKFKKTNIRLMKM